MAWPGPALQHLGWLLARAHGRPVRGLGDEPLGRMATLSYGADDRWPRALVLRPRGAHGLPSAAPAIARGACRRTLRGA